jgi:phage-related protein
VTKNDYEAEYERARQRAKSDEFAAVRRQHPAVERKLNELMNHHGGRRARYWGRAKVRVQQLMTGFVVNTKRFLCLLATLRAEPTAIPARGN